MEEIEKKFHVLGLSGIPDLIEAKPEATLEALRVYANSNTKEEYKKVLTKKKTLRQSEVSPVRSEQNESEKNK